VFVGLALASATTFLGQNPPPQAARQPGAPQSQAQAQPQNVNPNANAQAQPTNTTQPSNPAQPAAAGQLNQRGQQQPAPMDRQARLANSRQNRTRQNEEDEDAAWLGVFLNQREDEKGATINQVYPAGPAARAGLHSGDVIQQINGQQVSSGSELIEQLENLHPGDKAELSVLRSNEPTKVTVTLGSRNAFGYGGQQERFGGRRGQYAAQSDEDVDNYNIPLHAMELEHNRRNAEQHQRIENEIAQLREEIRQLRETLQRR